jgi:hypothetical protein
MKLRELEAHFIRRETRACGVGVGGCATISPHTEHEYHVQVDAIAEADGVFFLCPKCFNLNKGPVGTHGVICWRPRVPLDILPNPGRWELEGTSIDDLSLRASSSSVLLKGGCDAHFFVANGEIVFC